MDLDLFASGISIENLFVIGELHSKDPKVFTFGYGIFGRLGHGDRGDRLIPTMITSVVLPRIIQVSCGGNHTALLTKEKIEFKF
jgi:alpha-tubulin suppressor-like RCC1 family protein